MIQPPLNEKDLVLSPLVLLVIVLISYRVSQRKYGGTPFANYYRWGLWAKCLACLAVGPFHYFTYGDGDTFSFYRDSTILYDAFWTDPITSLKLILLPIREGGAWDQGVYSSHIYFYQDPGTYMAIRFGALFSLFSLNTYSVISLGFAIVSFSGIWRLFLVVCDLFPKYHRQLLFVLLLIPSVTFWGSGYLKDSLTLSALGWAIYGFYFLSVLKQNQMKAGLTLVLSCYMIFIVKIYILLPFLVAAGIWFYYLQVSRINDKVHRLFFRPLLAVLFLGVSFGALSLVSNMSSKYDLETIVKTSNVMANYVYYVSENSGGNSYQLSELFDGSLRSFFVLFPQAVNVSFFRPYLWEARNPAMVLSAVENAFILLLAFRCLVAGFRRRFWKLLRENPYFIFSICYSILFAFAIGVSTYNFGSLMRYRIPMLPLLISTLYLLYKESSLPAEEVD